MPLEIVTVPCRSDNYAFLLHSTDNHCTAVIDVPDAAPIEAAMRAKGWGLTDIWITHHHPDHVDGVASLVAGYAPRVLGAAADAHRLPPLDLALSEDEWGFDFYGIGGDVLEVPGHTVGHIAFYVPAAKALFTGDSLMALGCGRLFEGTPAQMYASLQKIAALPADTMVYSGHEYTTANARFALTIEPDNPDLISRVRQIEVARAAGQPTVPSSLAEELATNPFLRAHVPAVAANLNMTGADPVDVFTEIRARKDVF